jgi:hypothetical protein
LDPDSSIVEQQTHVKELMSILDKAGIVAAVARVEEIDGDEWESEEEEEEEEDVEMQE